MHTITNLEKSILLLLLKLVRAENVVTTLGLISRETSIVALQELEDVLDNDCLEVDLLLIIQVFCFQFDLNENDEHLLSAAAWESFQVTYLRHIDIRVWRVEMMSVHTASKSISNKGKQLKRGYDWMEKIDTECKS